MKSQIIESPLVYTKMTKLIFQRYLIGLLSMDENGNVLLSVDSYRNDVKMFKYDLTFGSDVNEVIWIITDSSNKRTLISNEPNQVNDTVRGRS